MKATQITRRFAELRKSGEVALVPFIMAGDPDLGATRDMLHAVADAGADLVELGVPFSDPTADGPVLQRSAARALERGTSLQRILEMVSDLRRNVQTPIVLFGYYNPIFHYGPEALTRDARQAGVDGLLVVDLPPDESDELWQPARAAGLDMIFLLAPTSDSSRVRAVLRKASGFVYYVSMTGVTGSRAITPADVRPEVERVRTMCKLPIGVGFGITSGAEAAAVAAFADAVVVGTSIMQRVEQRGAAADLANHIGDFARELKVAIRKPISE
jgi:tryptophan synthase alpha chain